MPEGYVARQIEDKLKEWFHGYSTKRVSNHLKVVELATTKKLISYKSFLGIKYEKKYETVKSDLKIDQSLEFTKSWNNIHHGRVQESYKIEYAVDESTKTVYWKAEFSERKLQYE